MAIFTNHGLDDKTQYLLGKTLSFSMILNLYMNNYVPSLASTISDFVPLIVTGYTPVTLLPVNWTGGTSAGLSDYVYTQITFTFGIYAGSPISVYGYFVQNPTSGNIVFAEGAAAPYLIPFSGGQLLLTPEWLDENA